MLRKKGFTLIELLVVISIIALLMAIMMPALSKVRKIAKLTVCRTRLKNAGIAFLAYSSSNDDNLPVSYWRSGNRIVNTRPSEGTDHAWRSYVMKEVSWTYGRANLADYGTEVFGYGSLWQGKYLDDPDVFICTESRLSDAAMSNFEHQLKNFDDDDKIKRCDAQYSYMPLQSKPVKDNSGNIKLWPHASKASQLSSSSALCMDKVRSLDHFSHVKSGSGGDMVPLVNVCFGDGHVITADNREFFTKEKIDELMKVTDYMIQWRDVLGFLDSIEP
jgi:prepilin-type N-terminal cleavage/methylation domain-containing protein/prepilin-type processing-associated H-X9-DG protein